MNKEIKETVKNTEMYMDYINNGHKLYFFEGAYGWIIFDERDTAIHTSYADDKEWQTEVKASGYDNGGQAMKAFSVQKQEIVLTTSPEPEKMPSEKTAFKYIGTWETNNGNTFGSEALLSNNKETLRKNLISIIDGNLTSRTDVGSWEICDIDNNTIIHGDRKW